MSAFDSQILADLVHLFFRRKLSYATFDYSIDVAFCLFISLGL